jgi:hypothetical protein
MVFSVDGASGGARWPLVRIGVGATCEVISLAHKFLPLPVHWTGQSTVCAGEGCDLCELLPTRGVYYLPVMCQGRTSILELASQSSSHLEMHCKLLHGGLQPGLVIMLRRRSPKAPVGSEVIDRRPGCVAVPMEIFASRVAALYHLPGCNPDEALSQYELRLQSMCRVRNKITAARMRGGVQGVQTP